MESSMVVATLPPPPYPESGQSVFPNHQTVVSQQQQQQKQGDGEGESIPSAGEVKEYLSSDYKRHDSESETLEHQKKLVYKHPLFPLMALLFEKCEQATQTPECPSSESFDVDIQAFVQHQDADNLPILVNNAELDALMVKAIQVLRIHLLELEKVNDLCKDFCLRYISCLKGKLQSEQLLQIDGMESPEHDSSMLESPSPVNQATTSNVTLAPGQIMSGNTVYQMVQTPQGLVAQPIQMNSQIANPPVSTTPIQGSTPLSQIGAPTTSSPEPPTTPVPSILPMMPKYEDEDCDRSGAAKRGILPKQATQVMKTWLFQHIVHPYPTEDEKKTLSLQTGLSILQINNWFINARRRILQPMLDNANPDGAKKKPKPPQTRPQKYWPENLAQLSTQTPLDGDGRQVGGEEAMQRLTGVQHRISVSTGQLGETHVAELLQGMAHMVHTTNPDVSSMISNVQQATTTIVSQNGQLDSSLNIGHLTNTSLDNT